MPALAQQRCLHHAAREAVARCPECGQFYCRECITEHDDRVICADCLKKIAVGPVVHRRRLAALLPLVQGLIGLVLLWVVFNSIGRVLIRIPASFHEGTVWEKIELPE